MAAVKLRVPKGLTGNAETDIAELRAHQQYVVNELNYILNNLDDENILSTDTSESEE